MTKLVSTEAANRFGQYLAGENIYITVGDYPTAFFNLESRTIHLPVWNHITQDVADLLRAHEVGHALFTGKDVWHSAIKEANDDSFAGYLNVVEDSRIERMMKMQFKLKEIFSRGYMDLLNYGIFDNPKRYGKMANVTDFSSFLLIDRINLHEKIGAYVTIPFLNKEEELLLFEVQTTSTWDDVVAVAKKIYDYDEAKMSETSTDAPGGSNDSESSESNGNEDDDKSDNGAGEQSSTSDQNGGDDAKACGQNGEDDSDGNDENGDSDGNDKNGGGESNGEDSQGKNSSNGKNSGKDMKPFSATDEALRDNEHRLIRKQTDNQRITPVILKFANDGFVVDI